MRKSKLSNRFLYDFITLLYVYNEFIFSDIVKETRFKQLQEFVDGRVVKNRHFFGKSECIKTAYLFVKKIVDYMNE